MVDPQLPELWEPRANDDTWGCFFRILWTISLSVPFPFPWIILPVMISLSRQAKRYSWTSSLTSEGLKWCKSRVPLISNSIGLLFIFNQQVFPGVFKDWSGVGDPVLGRPKFFMGVLQRKCGFFSRMGFCFYAFYAFFGFFFRFFMNSLFAWLAACKRRTDNKKKCGEITAVHLNSMLLSVNLWVKCKP